MKTKKVLADFSNTGNVFWNLSVPQLYEHALFRGDGQLAADGPIIVTTGQYTGRSPDDKFVVKDKSTAKKIFWGKDNRVMEPEVFDRLYNRMRSYAQGIDLYVHDMYAGADPDSHLPIRVVSESPTGAMFADNMLVMEKNKKKLANFVPEFTVLHLPGFKAEPALDGTRTEAAVVINFTKKIVLIATAAYFGEIKKSIFTVMNYILPQKKVLSMHCSANVGSKKDVALFFGLSGTGKTTLSSDPERSLIGDDEHGWSDKGVFNFEGGCYAKVIRLSKEAEPQIYDTTKMFGTILENVVMNPETRKINLDDPSITENTRASYPIRFIPDSVLNGLGGRPKNIIMLTCDAFGVMPPISKMTPDQAMYHFISGYTAKVAGTERGITEPSAVFSACFGAPFMALNPTVYADLLGKKIRQQKVNCWLINTGWTEGPYGVGYRMPILLTRALISAALFGKLDDVEYEADPTFKVLVPKSCPGVDPKMLNPRNTWKSPKAYDKKAKMLAGLFAKNFKKYESYASKAIKAAAPIVK